MIHDATMHGKNAAIAKMFLRYPSLHGKGPEEMAMMISAYLETTRGFPSEIFSAACEALSKRQSPFPPSAGEVYSECNRLAADDFSARHPEPKRLPAPEHSDEHRAEMRGRLDALKADVEHGRLVKPHEAGHNFSAAQLADWGLIINVPGRPGYVMRTDEDGVPLKIPAGEPGAGQKVSYGYLTQYEAQQKHFKPIITKTVRSSFREKFDREKGRKGGNFPW